MKRTSVFAAAALGLLTLSACEHFTPQAAAPAPAPAAVTATSSAATVTAGTFSGLSDHITTGGASIVGTPGAYELVLAADFSLDGAPDPIVGFGNGGTYNPATKLGALQNKTGAQRYALPANFSPSDASEVYIWCEKFDVPLGVASFASAAPVASGTFSGLSDHITTGGATITGKAGAYKLVLASDFSLDGAPDPIVGFGKGGTYNPATKLGALQNKTGGQTYDLPANFNPADVSEVYIWCEKFDVPLGVASFTSAPVASGTFSGLSDHITTGGATITGETGAYKLVLASDFSLDGAPDPIVGFGKDGSYAPATKLGALQNKTGGQTYDLPANFNPADVSEVYIWCEKFDVPLGVAKF